MLERLNFSGFKPIRNTLKAQLIDRNRRPVRLTEEGVLLYKTLLEQKREIQNIWSQISNQTHQKPIVKIGFIESLMLSI